MDDQNQNDANGQSPLGMPMDYQQVLEADLLELLGAKDASDEDKKAIYEKAITTIENRVIARLMDDLSEEEMEQWENIPEGDQDATHKFLEAKNIDLPKLYAAEALIYKTEIASLANQLLSKE